MSWTSRLVRTCAALGLAVMSAASAEAQSAASTYVGRPVEDIRMQVEGVPTTDQALLDLVEVRRGETLAMPQVRESIVHLYSLGRYQDVQVEAAAAPAGGVLVTFNLIPMHNVNRIEFAGTLGLSAGLLKRTVVERYGQSPSVGRIEAAARTLQQLYADNGYLRAKVGTSTEVLHNPDRTLLTFTIDAGPRAAISTVDIEGDPRTTRDDFLNRIGAKIGAPYLRPQLQEKLESYVQRLRDRRYYEAEATLRGVESDDGSTVALSIDIDSGRPVTVRFAGDPIPEDRLKELAPLETEGTVNEDLLEDSEARLENYLRQQGYWKADVAVQREESDAGVAVVFTVTRGQQYRTAAAVEITGSQALSLTELQALVALEPGALFVESRLSAAVSAILEYYRQRGFAGAVVRSGVNETDPVRAGEGLVRPTIVIVEGPRSLMGDVTIVGNSVVPTTELRPLVAVQLGEPYYEPRVIQARDALSLEYLNRGFPSAAVSPTLKVSDDRTRIDLAFTVQEGAQTIVDHILIVGNEHTKQEVILRELQFRPGQPFGLQDQVESRRRLSALGLFRRVRINELPHGGSEERDILVTVEEAPVTTIGYGGGVEAMPVLRSNPDGIAEQQLEFAPRGFFDIGRRNLFGANRSVNLYTRVSLRPKDEPADPEVNVGPFGFSEYRVVATYRQPRWFGPNDMTVTGLVEQGARTTYNFARRGVNLDIIRRLTAAVRVSGRYSFSSTRTFDEQLSEEDQATIDRLFPRVRLSGFSGAVARDTRDDLLQPTRGTFISGEGTVAARALGGQVGFMKAYGQAFGFRRLPGRRTIVLASRVAIGLADGFEREVQPTDPEGNPLPGPPIVVEDLPASERFFAGGDSTIRGFALDSVGAPNTISDDGYPTGGNAVVLLNSELRFPVWRDVGAVVFIDGGNVFRRVTEFDITELRGSVGFGLRYHSPVGPIRLDLGFKLDRREERGERGTALHFSLGQAF